jgi:hypothetical protein
MSKNLENQFKYDDGGRGLAGYEGSADDCVCRAIAIVTGLSYKNVYDRLAEGHATQRRSKHDKGTRSKSARDGIFTTRKWFKDYMVELGFKWTPTMQIGSGCQVHLRSDELPSGRLVCNVSRHMVAVIDGVVHDTYDASRDGTRCVYGYWKLVS